MDFPIDGMTSIYLILADMLGFTQTFVGIWYWNVLNRTTTTQLVLIKQKAKFYNKIIFIVVILAFELHRLFSRHVYN